MTSSDSKFSHRTRQSLHPVFSLPALRRRGAFWIGLGLLGFLCSSTGAAAPSPIQSDFDGGAVLVTLPASAPTNDGVPSSPEAMAREIKRLISEARRSGDPRFLGYAERLFNQQTGRKLSDELLVLRATLAQSLHQFDAARQDLQAVLDRSEAPMQRAQALVTLANIELVQGHYDRALALCEQLKTERPGLIATSCHAQVTARAGEAQAAYDKLTATTQSSSSAGIQERLWAQGTLGDIAAQLGKESAARHWQWVLSQDPDDLYTRAQLADWYLNHEKPSKALAVTKGYEAVDNLAVIRAIAMRHVDHPGASALASQLRERFDEALWRGSMLHQRDLARFELDIEQRPSAAVKHAMANWATQREPLDTRLALRSAIAAQDNTATAQLRDWLKQKDQFDARYPEGS
ncbi:MAG: tetratricopeptide repeat protein [Marinobacter sp.]